MKAKWSRANYSTVLSVLPNGNIRTHLDDYKKTSIAEGQYINPRNISPTIIQANIIKIIDMAKKYRIRKLTPTECYRLMGVREGDVQKLRNCGVSESQQYKMAGNSIVVDVLIGIFGQMFNPQEKEDENQITFPWW